jgi:hypothetical protein
VGHGRDGVLQIGDAEVLEQRVGVGVDLDGRSGRDGCGVLSRRR